MCKIKISKSMLYNEKLAIIRVMETHSCQITNNYTDNNLK